ncbi:hypothetical protein SPONL_281 [uncultured Candidatus Thioglobus sp.]|nr:hypothetical protein SPONL_281 [uncultured Candidatus Thioglobus sp.]
MKSLAKNFLAGIGSLLAIFPSTNYAQFIPKQTATKRMRSHWENTGNYISSSTDRFGNEQSEQK